MDVNVARKMCSVTVLLRNPFSERHGACELGLGLDLPVGLDYV